MTTHNLKRVKVEMVKQINRQSVVDEIYDQIIQKIYNGYWGLGEKLPSEHQLCEMLGVSRTSIRSALQKLSVQKIIEIKHGQGSFVSNFAKVSILSSLDTLNVELKLTKEDILEMLEFREAIEFKCIDLAVERATEEDVLNLERALKKMIQNKKEYKKYTVADFEFHLVIAKASKNKLLFEVLKNSKYFYLYLEELNRVIGVNQNSIDGHTKQYECFKKRDAEGIKDQIRRGVMEMLEKLNMT